MGLKAVSSIGGGSIAGAQAALGIIPSYPTKLARYRLALANVRNGTSDMRILCVGDSTTEGIGSTLGGTMPNTGSWPTRLAQLINSAVTPAAVGVGIPTTILAGGSDNRWTPNSWSKSAFGAGAGAAWASVGPSTNLIYTPGILADQYYVYYLGALGVQGTSLSFTATGGTAVTVNPGALANGTYRTICTAATASTANTVTITAANGSSVNSNIVVGVEPVLSSKKQVLVGNAGVGGVTTSQWSGLSDGFHGPDFIKAVAPDLTIISLGVNDATASNPAATVATNIQVIVTAALISGDVILMDMPPSGGAPYTAVEPGYIAAYQNLAANNNIIYASIYNRLGGSYNTPFMSDTLHPNDQGYWDWAQYIKELLGLN